MLQYNSAATGPRAASPYSLFSLLKAIRLLRLAGTGFACGLMMLGSGCNHSTAYVNNRAGFYQYRAGNYAMAQQEFERAIANNPESADSFHNLAASCCRAGNFAEGEQYYRQALAIDPEHQPSYHNLALMMQQNGRDEEAGRLLQGWADTQPNSDAANVELAWYRKSHGDAVGAEQALVQALQLNPKNHTAASNLGDLYHEQGRAPEALALYEKSMHRRWDQPQVQERIASLKSSYPGTMPNQAFVANLSRGSSAQMMTMPSGSGTVESVAAFPLPRFQPNLWADKYMPSSAMTTGTTIVQSPNGGAIPMQTVVAKPALTGTPIMSTVPVSNMGPVSTVPASTLSVQSPVVGAEFEVPSEPR